MTQRRTLARMRSISLILFWLFAVSAEAAIIYVDRDQGCPGSGTTGTPYCNIQNAFNVVNAGDTIRIRDSASTYDMTATLTRSGSLGSRITIEPDTGHNPTLRYTGSGSDNGVMVLEDVSYVTVQNLNFNGSGVHTSRWAVYVHATSANPTANEILTNTFQNWGGSTANASSASITRAPVGIDGGYCNPTCSNKPVSTVVRGNTFTDNRQNNIFIQHADDTLVENNTMTGLKCGLTVDGVGDTVGIGIWDSGTSSSSGTIIRGNSIHDFAPRSGCGIAMGTPYATSAGIWCDVEPRNGLIEKNQIYNINQPTDTDRGSHESQGIFIEAGCSGWVVQNNVIYNIGGAGIRQRMNRSGRTANLYTNNTIYKIGYNGIEFGVTGSGNPGTIRNNIVMDAGESQIHFEDSSAVATINYNLYWDSTGSKIGNWGAGVVNFATWKSQCSCDANSVNAFPKFVGPLP